MKRYILDASFLVSVLTGDGGRKPTEFFEKLLLQVEKGNAELISLQFAALEVSNALRFKIVAEVEATKVYQRFINLPLKLLTLELDQMSEVMQMAYQTGTTVYDASYHFLARSLGGVLVVCDKHYFQKAKKLGGIEFAG